VRIPSGDGVGSSRLERRARVAAGSSADPAEPSATGATDQHQRKSPADEEADRPFEDWERYPMHEAEENVEYQKLAWYAAPFGDGAIGLLILAFVINGLRRVARAVMRLLMR
jgi:hypothetical protein